ncbi:hypothetical protein MHYP_G00284100 [Metynnis hypsauchen]
MHYEAGISLVWHLVGRMSKALRLNIPRIRPQVEVREKRRLENAGNLPTNLFASIQFLQAVTSAEAEGLMVAKGARRDAQSGAYRRPDLSMWPLADERSAETAGRLEANATDFHNEMLNRRS